VEADSAISAEWLYSLKNQLKSSTKVMKDFAENGLPFLNGFNIETLQGIVIGEEHGILVNTPAEGIRELLRTFENRTKSTWIILNIEHIIKEGLISFGKKLGILAVLSRIQSFNDKTHITLLPLMLVTYSDSTNLSDVVRNDESILFTLHRYFDINVLRWNEHIERYLELSQNRNSIVKISREEFNNDATAFLQKSKRDLQRRIGKKGYAIFFAHTNYMEVYRGEISMLLNHIFRRREFDSTLVLNLMLFNLKWREIGREDQPLYDDVLSITQSLPGWQEGTVLPPPIIWDIPGLYWSGGPYGLLKNNFVIAVGLATALAYYFIKN